MSTIWKFPLAQAGQQTIEMPLNPQFLDVQVQLGNPCLWALVDPNQRRDLFTIHIFGTGHEVPDHLYLQHLGTFQLLDGQFIGHVFLELPVPT